MQEKGKTGMETIHIALAADQNYAQHAGITLLSVLTHIDPERTLSVVILSNGIDAANQEKILSLANGRKCSIDIHEIEDHEFAGIKERGHLTKATCCRLLLPKILSPAIPKILYLDTDVIVRQDIAPLWDTDIRYYHAAAVEDLGMKARYIATLDMPHGERYCNSGVMLMNLDKWREDGIGEKCLAYLAGHTGDLVFMDQDAINVNLWGKWMPIHPKWNVSRGFFRKAWKWRARMQFSPEVWEAVRNPAIVHFTSTYKPWLYTCGVPFAEEYMHLVEHSPWKGYEYPDISLKSFLKRKEYHLRQHLAKLYHAHLLRP